MRVPPLSSPSLAPIFAPVEPDDTVFFTVICQPRTPISAADFRARLAGGGIDELRPDPVDLARVVHELRSRGFTVSDQRVSPIVIASGRAALFQSVFPNVRLTRMSYPSPHEDVAPAPATVLARESEQPDAHRIPGALIVSVPEPPRLATTSYTQNTAAAFCLDLRNGVARRIGAVTAAGLRKPYPINPGKSRTRREAIRVAVIDTGFADHNFFTPFNNNITRLPSNTAPNASADERHHGTYVLANLLACAPTVEAYAVKYYNDIPDAFAVALAVPRIRIISLSWFWDVNENPDLSHVEGIRFQILDAVSKGVTVIVAAGNYSTLTFPALMPEVVAVGGVAIDGTGDTSAWPGSAAFTSSSRVVPDLCGVASEINLPWPFNGNLAEMQCREGETSCAAPQVAAVASLLYEKNGSLTPLEVKLALMVGAADVVGGHAYGGAVAVVNRDPATGHGLVDAVASWYLVP